MEGKVENERESELKVGLSRLEADANDLRARVKELRDKLSPVMREIQATPTAEAKADNLFSPTGQEIGRITGTVNETAGLIHEIIQHLEV